MSDDRDQFHAERVEGIGGSDIAILAGLSTWGSPTSLYYEKIGQLPPSETTQRQRIGQRMETVLAAEFHDMTGLHVVRQQELCVDVHPNEHRRCHIDGAVVESLASDPYLAALGVIEFKTDGGRKWAAIPDHYRAQAIWQMGVTGLRHAWFMVMFGRFQCEVYELPFDEADWKFLCDVADRFWHEHVIPQVPPPVDDHDATTSALAQVLHVAHDDGLDVPPEAPIVALVDRWHVMRDRRKAAEADEAAAANMVRDHLVRLETDKVTVAGTRLVTFREQSRSGVDSGRLKDEWPDVYEQVATKSTFRVLR